MKQVKYSDDNDIQCHTEHNKVVLLKDLTLTLNNDDNNVDIDQKKNFQHTATITLLIRYTQTLICNNTINLTICSTSALTLFNKHKIVKL